MQDLLRRQWDTLVDWLEQVDIKAHADSVTGLADWTVGDLVAHVGLGLGLANDIRPAENGDEVLTIGQYVGAYPAAASEIADMTRRARAELEADPVGSLKEIGKGVWRSMSHYDDEIIRARRGPMRTTDYVVTRLIELVVHGDDLRRAIETASSPVLPESLAVVSDALARAYRERTGAAPEVADPLTWIRVACGRVPNSDPALPLL